jgi:hypothetical protein
MADHQDSHSSYQEHNLPAVVRLALELSQAAQRSMTVALLVHSVDGVHLHCTQDMEETGEMKHRRPLPGAKHKPTCAQQRPDVPFQCPPMSHAGC